MVKSYELLMKTDCCFLQFVSSMVKRYQDNQLLMNTGCCFCSLSAVWWRAVTLRCWWTLTVFAVCEQHGEEVWDVDEHWLPCLQFVSSMVTSYGMLMNTDCFCSLWAVWWKAMRRSWRRTAGSTRAGSLLLPETHTGGWHSTCWRTFSHQVCQTRQHCWIHFLPTSSSHEWLTSKLSVYKCETRIAASILKQDTNT